MGDKIDRDSVKGFDWIRFFFWSGVLLFVLICVAIAVPKFLVFAQPARQSEAKTNLGAIFTCQIAYIRESGEYGSTFEQLQWAPERKTLYAYYCADDIIVNTISEPIDLHPEKNWPYQVKPTTSKSGFTCMAIGNVDADETLDVWAIDDTKNLRNIINDVIDGARAYP